MASGAGPLVPAPSEARDGGAAGALDYHVKYTQADRVLSVELTLAAGLGGRLEVDRAGASWVRGVAWSRGGGAFSPAKKDGATFVTGCGPAPCVVRYTYRLGEAAKAIDDVDTASDEREVVEAPPSTWLLVPSDAPQSTRARFHVETEPGVSFATGVYRSVSDPSAWEISLDDLQTSPYTVFGPLRRLDVTTPRAGLEVVVAPGALAASDAELRAWIENAARSVVGYFDGFPTPSALLVLLPGRGPWVGGGRSLAGGGATVLLRLGDTAKKHHLDEDWVLVHEMVHLGFPSVARKHTWAEEGLATYVEPIARVRAGLMSEADAWASLVQGLPNGLPKQGDKGLDRTPTWGRTYWGGALFYLLADVEIRRASQNARGLEHALRGILRAGGNNASRWPLTEALDVGDRACGVRVLRPLHARMGEAPMPVDLPALQRSLGVRVEPSGIRLDDRAELAHVRRAIMRGAP